MFDRKEYYKQTRDKQRATAKRWREEHPEEYRAMLKRQRSRRRKDNPVAWLLDQAKVRARNRNIPFDITAEDLLPAPSVCPVLGIPLSYDTSSLHTDHSASLDRIIPDRGYVRGNVLIVSWRANRIKCDATPTELRAVAEFYSSRV